MAARAAHLDDLFDLTDVRAAAHRVELLRRLLMNTLDRVVTQMFQHSDEDEPEDDGLTEFDPDPDAEDVLGGEVDDTEDDDEESSFEDDHPREPDDEFRLDDPEDLGDEDEDEE